VYLARALGFGRTFSVLSVVYVALTTLGLGFSHTDPDTAIIVDIIANVVQISTLICHRINISSYATFPTRRLSIFQRLMIIYSYTTSFFWIISSLTNFRLEHPIATSITKYYYPFFNFSVSWMSVFHDIIMILRTQSVAVSRVDKIVTSRYGETKRIRGV
jgi:hypothetical protein